MFDRNSKTIKLDNSVLVTLSSEVEEVKFKPFYKDRSSQAPECVLLIVKPSSKKFESTLFRYSRTFLEVINSIWIIMVR